MTDPTSLLIEDFTYDLPSNRIAKHPLDERDASKLLVYQHQQITDSHYRNLADYLPDNALMIFNDTKVVEARLLFTKPSGGQIEVFCLEPSDHYPDISTALATTEKVYWKCLVGGASKWKHGVALEKNVSFAGGILLLQARIADRLSDCFIIELSWQPTNLSFAEILHFTGTVPLPPYLNRPPEAADSERYQTIYARFNGSVAAPTAGLHFTENLFKSLAEKNITAGYVTLHVGAGTFKPVKTRLVAGHEMHSEFMDVSVEMVRHLAANVSKFIVAVGTTSLRTIESLYWMGVKITLNEAMEPAALQLLQWDPYQLPATHDAGNALINLANWMEKHQLPRLIAKTQVMIAPGYHLKVAKALVTNFHQPQSTLLLLIAAIVGNQWRAIYQHAMENEYRFLSYGDGCLLFSEKV